MRDIKLIRNDIDHFEDRQDVLSDERDRIQRELDGLNRVIDGLYLELIEAEKQEEQP